MTKKVQTKKSNTSDKNTETVTKNSNLGELIYKHPEVAEVLIDYGLHCVGCMLNSYDTIEAGAKVHGMDEIEISEMVERINEVIESGE